MAASNTDQARKNAPVFATTLSGSITSDDTTIPLQSITDLPTDTAISMTLDATDSSGNPTPSKKEVVVGVVNSGGTELINCIRGVEGTQQSHASGAEAVGWFTAADWNSLITLLLTQHNQDGTHGAITASSLTVTGATVIPGLTVTGMITLWPATAAPTGWLIANGAAVSRATYSSLFALVGITYGAGNGTTTFNLPNIAGAFPAGYKASDANFGTLGGTGGALSINLAHNHTNDTQGAHSHSGTTSNGNYNGGASNVLTQSTSFSPPGHNHTFGTDVQGAHSHNISSALGSSAIVPPYITLNYIIKT